jgi:hypothetical protein
MERLTVLQRVRRKCRVIKSRRYESRKADYLKKISYENKIIILGNQKTGSTVIADLIAKRSGKSVSLDIQGAIYSPSWLLEQRYRLADFSDFIFQHQHEFDRKIVKEPSLTFFYNDLVRWMPEVKYAFIVRNPFDNIRSILNRLKIPGDLKAINIDDWPELSYMPTWKLAVDSTWLGCPNGSYIEALAYRWCVAADVFLENNDAMYLIKYEDFLKDKVGVIDDVCRYFCLGSENDISAFLDKQYQKKGKRGTDLLEFFGRANYERIENICGDRARKFGYNL